jgi:hypothetical protein
MMTPPPISDAQAESPVASAEKAFRRKAPGVPAEIPAIRLDYICLF